MRMARWTRDSLAALLAVILLLLSACSSGTGGGSPSTPTSGCAALLPGAVPASAGTSFPQLPFPQGAVSAPVAQQSSGDGQFTIALVNVCAPNTSPSAVTALYTSKLPSQQWSQSKTFPFDGSFQDTCGQGSCWTMDNATLYLKVENVADKGSGLVTYALRLGTPPPAPACGANFTDPMYHTQLGAAFQSTYVYATIPLPPLTRTFGNNAAGFLGTGLCSAGTTASITAFMTKQLTAQGWQQINMTNNPCPPDLNHHAPTCWQNSGHYLVWAINSTTDWIIVFHNPDLGG